MFSFARILSGHPRTPSLLISYSTGSGLLRWALWATSKVVPHLSEEACLGLLVVQAGPSGHGAGVAGTLLVHQAVEGWSRASSSKGAGWRLRVASFGTVHVG